MCDSAVRCTGIHYVDAGLIVFMYNNRDSGAKDHVLDRNNITTPARLKLLLTLSVVRLDTQCAPNLRLYTGVKTRESQAKSSFPTRDPKLEHRLHIASKPLQQFVVLNPQIFAILFATLATEWHKSGLLKRAKQSINNMEANFSPKTSKAIANAENLSFKERGCSGPGGYLLPGNTAQPQTCRIPSWKEIRLCPLGPQWSKTLEQQGAEQLMSPTYATRTLEPTP